MQAPRIWSVSVGLDLPHRGRTRAQVAELEAGNTIIERVTTQCLLCCVAQCSICSRKLGDITSSESKKLTHVVVTACKPLLRAAAAPGVGSERSRSWQGVFCCFIHCSTTALLLSVEALSTTMS